jgi:hypothetical protein
MHHIGPCHVANGTYSILCHTILMMCTHSTESQLLFQMFTMQVELSQVENTTINVNELDFHSGIGGFSFKD